MDYTTEQHHPKTHRGILPKLSSSQKKWFCGWSIVVLATTIAAAITQQWWVALAPLAFLSALFILAEPRKVYLLLWALLPISIEWEYGSFSTDLPDEFLMIALAGVTLLLYLAKPPPHFRQVVQNPILVLLVLHVVWIGIAVIYSANTVVSLKFFLAKLWYVLTFVGLTLYYIRRPADLKPFIWWMAVPLGFVALQTIVRHAEHEFSFDSVNHMMTPFFRNHVNYAVMLSLVIPFLWYAKRWYPTGSFGKMVLYLLLAIFLVGVGLAYTRAAYVSLLAIPFFYLLIRYRLSSVFVITMVVGLFIGGLYLLQDNRYIHLAPDYEETIYHEEFDDHLSATLEGKDVSFMERLYRWVAAFRMFSQRPVVGFGPGNFYNYYLSYTINQFETYVSDNPEKSGTHNYYLMLLAEQGIVGLGLFGALFVAILLRGEKIYHRQTDPDRKAYVMLLLIVLEMIFLNLLVSDLIETDKVGSIFFICIALLINMDVFDNCLPQSN